MPGSSPGMTEEDVARGPGSAMHHVASLVLHRVRDDGENVARGPGSAGTTQNQPARRAFAFFLRTRAAWRLTLARRSRAFLARRRRQREHLQFDLPITLLR